jgi:hypothetical protein
MTIEIFHKHHSNIRYLGDGAYIGISQFGELVIWAEDGISITNQVTIENANELQAYLKEVL